MKLEDKSIKSAPKSQLWVKKTVKKVEDSNKLANQTIKKDSKKVSVTKDKSLAVEKIKTNVALKERSTENKNSKALSITKPQPLSKPQQSKPQQSKPQVSQPPLSKPQQPATPLSKLQPTKLQQPKPQQTFSRNESTFTQQTLRSFRDADNTQRSSPTPKPRSRTDVTRVPQNLMLRYFSPPSSTRYANTKFSSNTSSKTKFTSNSLTKTLGKAATPTKVKQPQNIKIPAEGRTQARSPIPKALHHYMQPTIAHSMRCGNVSPSTDTETASGRQSPSISILNKSKIESKLSKNEEFNQRSSRKTMQMKEEHIGSSLIAKTDSNRQDRSKSKNLESPLTEKLKTKTKYSTNIPVKTSSVSPIPLKHHKNIVKDNKTETETKPHIEHKKKKVLTRKVKHSDNTSSTSEKVKVSKTLNQKKKTKDGLNERTSTVGGISAEPLNELQYICVKRRKNFQIVV